MKNWKFTQVFGNQENFEKKFNEDITSIEFTDSGNYLLIGDNKGRLIIFQKFKNDKRTFCEYNYLNEIKLNYNKKNIFTAKYQEYINNLKVLPKQIKDELFLITSDNKIKLLKLKTKEISNSKNFEKENQNKKNKKKFKNDKNTKKNEIGVISLKREFPDFHKNSINSISLSTDGERFLSSDDFKILLWDLENTKISYSLKNINSNLANLEEIITKTQFSPKNDFSYIYGTSKGDLFFNDLRQKMDLKNSKKFSSESKNLDYFSKISKFCSDLKFGKNGDKVFMRDFLGVKIWDLKMDKKPLMNFELFSNKKKLIDIYKNNCSCEIFDLSLSKNNDFLLTGSFDNKFHIYDFEKNSNFQYNVGFQKKTSFFEIKKNSFFNQKSEYDFSKKILKTAWSPVSNSIVVASRNCLFFYNSKK